MVHNIVIALVVRTVALVIYLFLRINKIYLGKIQSDQFMAAAFPQRAEDIKLLNAVFKRVTIHKANCSRSQLLLQVLRPVMWEVSQTGRAMFIESCSDCFHHLDQLAPTKLLL
jgi:hypothetical protein